MKTKKTLYVIAGVFNCIIGGMSILLGLFILLLSGMIRKMFEGATSLINSFVNELAKEDSKYEYLTDASTEEVVGFIMKIVYIVSIIALIIGAIWITFGIFNIVLKNKHETIFETKKYLRHVFVATSWLFMGLNVANILTSIAVYKPANNTQEQQKLYTANDN